jgi:uncharacterized radical SAM superfamily protein
MILNKSDLPHSKKNRILTFAIPGGKVYISDYYRNTQESFLNISITGNDCQLQCRHCRGELLKGMIAVKSSKRLVALAEKYLKSGKLKGMLISGGFDKNGKLPFAGIIDGIKEIKAKYPYLTLYIHTGFLSMEEIKALKSSGVDAVLTNLIKSKKDIEYVYNLRVMTYRDYTNTIKMLKSNGLKVSPHIIIGLENGELSDEFTMVEDAIGLKVDSIVFVILKKASADIDFPSSKVPHKDIIRLIEHARGLSPDMLLSFGCAKPPGRDRHLLEIGLIKAGIDAIAFPSEKTVNYAVENKIAHTFLEKCCAIL